MSAGRLGGSLGGGAAGARGAASGAERAARKMRTVVAEHQGVLALSAGEIRARCIAAFDTTHPIEPEDAVERFVVPVGRTGLQQVVVDLLIEPISESEVHVIVRAFAKEGRLSRHPAQSVADGGHGAPTASRTAMPMAVWQ